MAAVLPSESCFDTGFLAGIIHILHAVSLIETYTVQHETLTVKALVQAQDQTITCKQVCQAPAAHIV